MQIRVANNQVMYLENIPPVQEDAVDKKFSAQRPYRHYSHDSYGGGVVRRYDATKKRLNRAFLVDLLQLCVDRGFPADLIDERKPWKYEVLNPKEIKGDFLPGITLEDYQIRSIRLACHNEIGIIDVPTGGGKTEIMAGICKAMPCPTVILADQLVIIDQIKERLELREIINEVGLFYAGQTPAGQEIIVGSIQSVSMPSMPEPPQMDHYKTAKGFEVAARRHQKTVIGFKKRIKRARIFQEIIRNADMLIVDEADLAVNESYKYVFRYLFRGRRRYGLTGTVDEPGKEVQSLIMKEHFGPVIAKVERKEVEKCGRIIPIEYRMIAYDIGGSKFDASAFDLATNDLFVRNSTFHQFVAGVVGMHPDDGVLVLVQHDDLGYALADAIKGSMFIHGKTAPRKRNRVLDEFERRNLKVLIGGKILRRGLDLSGGCEVLFIATGGQMSSVLRQQIGRAVRLNRVGKAIVYDLFFLNNRYLYAHSRNRLKTVVQTLGYPAKVIFPYGEIDGKKFIDSRFYIPRNFR